MTSLLSDLDQTRARHPGLGDVDCVRLIASELIRELDLSAPPVDLEMLVSLIGINEVVRDQALDVAGCLTCHAGKLQIRVRATDSPGRQRFTICHECGHTFFSGFARRPQYRCAPSPRAADGQGLESLCDVAAAELLLPESMFSSDLSEMPFELPALETLAERYGASLEATGQRLVTLWPEDVALLVFEVCHKTTDGPRDPEKLRLTKIHQSGDWPFFRRLKSAEDGDAFDRALEGEVVQESCTLRGIVPSALQCEVHARPYHYWLGDDYRERVIALLRKPSRRVARRRAL